MTVEKEEASTFQAADLATTVADMLANDIASKTNHCFKRFGENIRFLLYFNQMSPQYIAEIFHPSSSVHNTRRATQKLDLRFRKVVLVRKHFPISDQKHGITYLLK